MFLFFFFVLLIYFLTFVLFYFLMVFLLKRISINKKPSKEEEKVKIYVVSNGAHTDIILPFRNQVFDWSNFINLNDFKEGKHLYVSFGWGDKGFYMDTPTWAELKPSVALKAILKLSRATMQVVLYEDLPESMKFRRTFLIGKEQYRHLVEFIKAHFEYNHKGEIIKIDFAGLPAYEEMNYKFYEAEGRYHLFKTCNCWVNDTLKIAGIKTSLWTPFANAVFHLIEEEMEEAVLDEIVYITETEK